MILESSSQKREKKVSQKSKEIGWGTDHWLQFSQRW